MAEAITPGDGLDGFGYALPEPPLPEDVPGLDIPDGTTVDALLSDGPHDAESWEAELEARREAQRVERLQAMGMPAKAVCGFAIILGEGGIWGYTMNLAGAKDIKFDREANQIDVWHGAEFVSSDAHFSLLLTNIVNNVMVNMDQRAQMAAEQMQNFQVARQAGLIDVTGRPVNRAERRHPGGGH